MSNVLMSPGREVVGEEIALGVGLAVSLTLVCRINMVNMLDLIGWIMMAKVAGEKSTAVH